MNVSNEIINIPPNTPKRVSKVPTTGKIDPKTPIKRKMTPNMNPEKQERPRLGFFLRNFPERRDPTAIPMAVSKNKYPPAYSDKPKALMASGMMFSCVKAPTKRK